MKIQCPNCMKWKDITEFQTTFAKFDTICRDCRKEDEENERPTKN